MSDVKWIKITTDMFDNRKIKHLRRLPDGNNIVLIWVMLLTMAGRCNAGGMIFLTENIPYTPKMLADELGFEENTVQLALTALAQFNMIVMDQGYFSIAGWSEYQNIEGMDKIREQNRLRKRKQREAQKALPEGVSRDSHGTVTDGHATEEDKELDTDKDKEIKRESIDCQQIVDLYHSICISFPKVKKLSDSRKKAIKARLNTYALDDFKTVFENAESSSFLKGANDRNWSADFDWLLKDSKFAKVLEGSYQDKPGRFGRKEMVPAWANKRELDEDELAAIKKMMNEPDTPKRKKQPIWGSGTFGEAELEAIQRVLRDEPDTAGNNPEIADRAEKLRMSLGVEV